MQRIIQLTADGSHTIAIPARQLAYHSRFGALQESRHVFIQAGLHRQLQCAPCLQVLEMGFGTGLNALLTLQEALAAQQAVRYTGIELYPLTEEEAAALNYGRLLPGAAFAAYLRQLHMAPWEQDVEIHPLFTLHKRNTALSAFLSQPAAQLFHLVYFDAFEPEAQPELWTAGVFAQLHDRMHPGAALVTYCSKGAVRRAMQAAGFEVQRLPGAPGKREMLRAVKK